MNYRIKWLSSVCYASVMMGLVMTSCAEGVDINEQFTQGAGVTNTQLESPELDPNKFKTQVNADGSESVEVSWPVIFGAGGYLANVEDITDPANPIFLVHDSVIDGCHFSFPREIDTKYQVSVSTLGNEKLNNTGSLTPTIAEYSTFVPATTIPEGVEISQFIAQNLTESTEDIAFELEAGKTYQLTGEVNFNLTPVIFRGNKYNRPLVVISNQGCIVTQAGLRIQNINFDCGAAEANSFIKLCDTPSGSISTSVLTNSEGKTFRDLGAKETNIIMGQIAVESCNFRNLRGSFIWGNYQDYNLNVFRIENCIVQLNNATSKSFINFRNPSGVTNGGLIKTLALSKSTFYNLEDNNDAFFFGGGNQSNAQPAKVFGAGATSSYNINYCTFDKTFTGKDFADQLPQVKDFVTTLKNNIFLDVKNVNKIRKGSAVMSGETNVFWGPSASADKDYGTIDEDPDFVGPTLEEFNLDEAKGGVNFRPQNQYCIDNKIGDPRWFE